MMLVNSYIFGGDTPAGQVVLTGSGVWIVPPGVYSISVVCIGGGGGGGAGANAFSDGSSGGAGGLRWATIPVTPGETFAYVVGARGLGATALGGTGGDGGTTTFIALSGATRHVQANGGFGGPPNTYVGSGNAGFHYGDFPSFGGTGGNGGRGTVDGSAGGGGGPGYSGPGGSGGDALTIPTAGAGGGGGGGSYGRGGGGVGLLGQGANGAAGGFGGSGGETPGNVSRGGDYGGGGGPASDGGRGGLRIIWGPGRAYPSTNTADVV